MRAQGADAPMPGWRSNSALPKRRAGTSRDAMRLNGCPELSRCEGTAHSLSAMQHYAGLLAA